LLSFCCASQYFILHFWPILLFFSQHENRLCIGAHM
jgi:hypothetical protein